MVSRRCPGAAICISFLPGRRPCPRDPGEAHRLLRLLTCPLPPTAHPERAALLFVSSVCIGLALTLCALVVRVSCTRDLQDLQLARERLAPGRDKAEEDSEDAEQGEDSSDSDFPGQLSGFCRTPQPVYTSTEAAELAERIERREQVIREIWMNSGLDASMPRSTGPFY